MGKVRSGYITLPYKVLACTTCYGYCGQCGPNNHREPTDRIPEHRNPDDFERVDCSEFIEEVQGGAIWSFLDYIGIVLVIVGACVVLYQLWSP